MFILPLPVDDVAVILLEVPFRDDDEVAEAGSHTFLDLAPDPTLPLHSICAAHEHAIVAKICTITPRTSLSATTGVRVRCTSISPDC
jgi:hypothetical protein